MNSSSASTPSSSSAPSANSRSMRKNMAGARTDAAWEHAIELVTRKVQCRFCNRVFTGGMYRFKNHLARTSQHVAPCPTVPEDVKVKFQNLLEQNELSSKKRRGVFIVDEVEQSLERVAGRNTETSKRAKVYQGTLNKIFKKYEREKVCQQIARFFHTSALSFNCVNNPEFGKMVKMIGDYGRVLDPPSYHEIRVTYLKKEVDYIKSILEDYKREWKKYGCTLMSDGWTDRKNRSICNFLVNSPRGTIFLASVDTSDIRKTKEKVFAMLDDFMEKIGEEHVVQVVTDNAANYKAAGEMLMEKWKRLFWTPCATHCIDLMLEDFEKKIQEHKDTIAKGKKITSFIYSRTRLICLLKEFTKGKELLRPGATRFATSYLTLGRLFEQKGALISMFASEKWVSSNFAKTEIGKQIESIILDTTGFWKSVSTCLTATIPLINVLRLVDSDSMPAMGFIYHAMVKAKAEIKKEFKDVQSRYQPNFNIIDERWESHLHKPLHVAGYFLNPRVQYSSEFKGDSAILKTAWYACIERMCGDANLANKVDCQFESFKNSRGYLFNLSTAKQTRDGKSPVDWWDSFGDDTPELKWFTMRVLSLTASSSGCERNWSALEMVHSKRRNLLQQQKLNDFVYVMYNIKLSGREGRKETEIAFVPDQLETSNFEDVGSDDEWIVEEEPFDSSHIETNEYNDGGDDAFLQGAIRNQFGGDANYEEDENFHFEEENGADVGVEILDYLFTILSCHLASY